MIPGWLAQVFAEDDANRAAVRESERKRAPQRVNKDVSGANLVFKTHTPTEEPQQAQPTPTMSPAEQAPWDEWADRRADQRVFALFKPGAPMGDLLAEVISLQRAEFRKELAEQIAALRLDVNMQNDAHRREIKKLRGSVPARRK